MEAANAIGLNVADALQAMPAKFNDIHESLVSKWRKPEARNSIEEAVKKSKLAGSKKRNVKKERSASRPALEFELLAMCKARRAEGRKVRRNWLVAQAKIIQKRMDTTEVAAGGCARRELTFSAGWISRFFIRHD